MAYRFSPLPGAQVPGDYSSNTASFLGLAEQIPSSSVSKRIKRATLNRVAGNLQLHSDTIISTLSDCSRRLSLHLNLMKAIQKRLGWRHRTYTLFITINSIRCIFPNSSFGYFRLDGGVVTFRNINTAKSTDFLLGFLKVYLMM